MPRPKSTTDIGVRAPTREIGTILGGHLSGPGMAPWSAFVDRDEFVPELMWPNSVQTLSKMRADSQLSALFRATFLGVSRFKWSIDPNGVTDTGMVEHISKDYNLPILGEQVNQRLRQKRRFAFKDHMRKAFYSGIYGHYFFEQVGKIGDDGMWHLQKLVERPPRTIQDILVAEDGGLVAIVQNVSKSGYTTWGQLPTIPVDNLIGYVWEQEGGNWAGRSWFRNLYKNWVIKDRLMRIDAINHERAGGVPYIEAQPGATFADVELLNKMAQGFRIGDTAGGAVPSGAKFQIARGTNSSVVDSIRYHDEAMAREFMLMVMQLGQTKTGSRALGDSFIEFWSWGLTAIADWFRDTFNEHQIEDDIDWNYGEDVDQVPLLHYEYDPEFSVQDLAVAVKEGVIVMDDDLENYARKEMGLTVKGTPRLTPDQELAQKSADAAVETAKQAAKDKAKPAGSQQPGTAAASALRVLPPSGELAAATSINDEEE